MKRAALITSRGPTPIERVEAATAELYRAEREWRKWLRHAARQGASLRAIAEAAGVSHEKVRNLVG